MKPDFEQYLKVSEFLNNKNSEDFKNYKKEFYKEYPEYNSEEKLKYLLKYYENEDFESKNSQDMIEAILIFKKTVITLSLVLGLLLTFFSFNNKININIYVITSIILPLIYLVYLAYRHFSYTFPSKDPETSILNMQLKKRFKTFKCTNDFSYVIKTYSTMLWIKSAIAYSTVALIATFIIFKYETVTFYSGDTFGANDYEINTIDKKLKPKVIVQHEENTTDTISKSTTDENVGGKIDENTTNDRSTKLLIVIHTDYLAKKKMIFLP